MEVWLQGIAVFAGLVGGGVLLIQFHERRCYQRWLSRHIRHLKARMAAQPQDALVCQARMCELLAQPPASDPGPETQPSCWWHGA